MGYWIVDGKQMTEAEYREHQRQEVEAKQRVQGEAAALVKKLGETYAALTGLMQQHPEVDREITDKTAVDEKIYEKLRQNLEQADKSPRCRWVRQDGTICGSPQMRKHIYCYAHKQMMEARALALRLPPPEDANAIQISVQRVQTALIDETISAKTAGLLLYSLQLAMTNVVRTTFGQSDQEMVTKVVDEEEALSAQQSAMSQKPELFTAKDAERRSGDPVIGASGDRKSKTEALTADEGGLGTFTAKDAEGAKEQKLEKGLPRINTDYTDRSDLPRIDADERGLEEDEEGSQVVTMRM